MFLFTIAEIVVTVGAIVFFYKDYKNDFARSREIIAWILDKIKGREGAVSCAERFVQAYAKQIGALREAVATIEANQKIAEKRAFEEAHLAVSFKSVVDEALRRGKDKEAAAAAVAKIQCEMRADLFREHAQQQIRVAEEMHDGLESAEMEFEIVKTQAETIKVYAALTEAKRQLYGLISEIEAKTGLTAKGNIRQILLTVETDMYKADSMLRLAGRNGRARVESFMRQVEVQNELEEARQRIALPPADSITDNDH